MLKKALEAAALLSVTVSSVGAYAATNVLHRNSVSAKKSSKEDDKDKTLLYLLGAGALGGGLILALDNGGNSDSP